MTPLLGWIAPQDRTQAQHDAHAAAVAQMPKFQIAGATKVAGPVKVVLTDLWRDPLIVADIGMEFPGFHQNTGSCVGVSAGNAVATLSFVQRKLVQGTTKAFIPFWPFAYGRTRLNEGDRGPGEGAVDSVMAQTLVQEGTLAWSEAQGAPTYTSQDGIEIPGQTEIQWSYGGTSAFQPLLAVARQHLVGAAAPLSSTTEIRDAICNGYPVLDGCSMYVGRGQIQGEGENACVLGNYDGQGGHSTCFLAYWDHPTLGPLFGYSNQWPAQTYPRDPAGLGRCCVWMKEASVARLFRLGGSGGETVALSHLTYFPAQNIIDWTA